MIIILLDNIKCRIWKIRIGEIKIKKSTIISEWLEKISY
jgi:hypothetical protein